MLYMVETQAHLDLVPNKSIDQLGASFGQQALRRDMSYGSIFLPMVTVICKGKRNLKLRVPEEILVHVQSKTWMDEEQMKDYIEHVWQ